MWFWSIIERLRGLACRVFGHAEGPRGDGHDAPVVIRVCGADGVVREREVPGTTYVIRCLRCGETTRGEVVLHSNVVVS